MAKDSLGVFQILEKKKNTKSSGFLDKEKYLIFGINFAEKPVWINLINSHIKDI